MDEHRKKQIRRIVVGSILLVPPALFVFFLDSLQVLIPSNTPVWIQIGVLIVPWILGLAGVILILLGTFGLFSKPNELVVPVIDQAPSRASLLREGSTMIAAALSPFALVLAWWLFTQLFSLPSFVGDGGIILFFFVPISFVFIVIGLMKIIRGFLTK